MGVEIGLKPVQNRSGRKTDSVPLGRGYVGLWQFLATSERVGLVAPSGLEALRAVGVIGWQGGADAP